MMTSIRPYLIRAVYEWIVDNKLTPYIIVNSDFPGVQIPEHYSKDGQIVLNIAPQACRGLHLENDRIVFSASFSGVAYQISFSPAAVHGIYAKENGKGRFFTEEDGDELPPEPPAATAEKTLKRSGNKPKLTVVK